MFDLDFPRAFPGLQCEALFRACPEDFIVNEDLGFPLAGTGQHVCVQIEKQEQNTVWVARQLAAFAGIKPMDVGYCGLKDRHAVTRQWFSIPTSRNGQLDISGFSVEGVKVLAIGRHDRKLRRGMHRGNHFVIRLRDVHCGHDVLSRQFEMVCQKGVPNYFGEQRFGQAGGNLEDALALQGQHPSVWRERKHQFALSAIRSFLFNSVLAARVRDGSWVNCVNGDPENTPTGPLWGRGRLSSAAELLAYESAILSEFPEWLNVLEHVGVQQERRALNVLPMNASQEWDGNDWILRFGLPPGSYATSVLRELVKTVSAV